MTAAKRACFRKEPVRAVGLCALLSLTDGCGGILDAGWDKPRGQLPVDDRNPIILCNDGSSDNWAGEYAMLFAGTATARFWEMLLDHSTFRAQ